MQMPIKGQSAGLAAAAALAVLLTLNAVGCSGTSGSSGGSDEQATRLGVNHPTNVDVKHDVPVPRAKVLELEVDFAPRHQAEHEELMRAIDNKKSPLYHHWLTPEEMHARFGETAEQFGAVKQWLQGEDFTITEERYGVNGDFIKFKGTAAQIEKTFRIRLVEPIYDRYINSEDPAIPAQFVGVISRVNGLYGLLP
jgi:subtilase family serine protease